MGPPSVVVRSPSLFQLRPHFVLGERIGIGEIGADQILTNHLHANEKPPPQTGVRVMSADIDGGAPTATM
ncbi:hypothetical protein EAS56_14125 [Bradyrhizobium guangzhouense]|uniref:Uncharacterized protein n=1 Tax=Bradyrhizobium guangzhouense TaxID=1325095 RepID=A0AAE5X248_9BRAD|nr:hypothetical protein XH91_18850 [Bradyrhizobium guangzhouense]RXH13729.1 hypothetical protein EAS56_14125 [Bradyrhizobium guangzhouense]